jgi:transcriptional regulator with XRE-family HTH domain
MGTDGSPYAQALYSFLEREWEAMDIRPSAWCRRVGLADATVLRWREGESEPDMRTIRRVADALERPVIDLLVAMGYVTRREAGGYEPPARTYDLLETIRLDPKLTDGEREALRQVYDAIRLVNSGKARKVRVRGQT